MTRIESRPGAAVATAILLFALAVGLPPGAAAAIADTPPPAAPAAAVPEAPPAAAPKLVVEPASWKSGPVARDSVVEQTFTLSNVGTAPLKIESILATGNTELSSRPTEIAPGGKVTITVRVPLLKERAVGHMKQIEINSNDPERPKVHVDLRIESTEYVEPRPDRARWISVQQEADGTIQSVLKAPDGKPFRVLGVSTPPPGIDVKVQPTVPAEAVADASKLDPKGPHAAWSVAMTLRKNAPVGAIVGQLEITVDHEKQKIVPIPLSGFMRPILAVTPHELVLGELPAASSKTHDFFVRNFATEGIQITKVETHLPGFGQATIEPEELGRRYRVKLPMDLSKNAPGAFQGVIRFYTDSAKVPFYSLPVSGVVTGP